VSTRRPWARTLPDLVRECSSRFPDVEAVVGSAGDRLTYAELEQQMDGVAAGLHRHGVGPGTSVGLLAPNLIAWVTAALGVQESGGRLAAFNTFVKPLELGFLLEHSQCAVLLIADRFGRHSLMDVLREVLPELWQGAGWRSERFPLLRSVIVIGDEVPPGALSWSSLLTPGTPWTPNTTVSAVDEAVIVYTSGSTARPKAVPLQHYAMIENGYGIGERMALTPRDRVWLGSPLFWSYGVANALMAAFTHGAALVLQAEYSAAGASELIARERCTAAYLLPAILHDLTALPQEDRDRLATLRTGLTIGRPDEVALALELGIDGICNIYGATEVYGNCCVTPHDMPVEQRMTCQGPPLPRVEIRLTDAQTGAPVEEGPAMIEVRGYATPGYLGEPELNARTFTADGWYRTGDLGVLLADGSLRFVARATDMIKTSGINVSPAEVEAFLRTLDGVGECVVVGAPDPAKDEVVVAFVQPTPGSTLDPQALMATCRASIAAYKVPARIHVVDGLPVTSTGKISRLALRRLAAEAADGMGA
jgi:acyl-CoA synthetase (AMP-forming)/AMP-acid ligase II